MISIIVAVAENGVIGCENRLIWHLSEDLRRFRRLTTGHAVVMGRRTYESIGRPLPNRTNIVVTTRRDFTAEGITVAHSVDEAIGACSGEIFIIGGGEIYRQTIDRADKIYLTLVHDSPAGDTFFPTIDPAQWSETERTVCDGYEFIDLIRNGL